MRSPLLALVKKDIKSYFDQPAAYILIVPFVAILSYVYFSSALLAAEASLRPLFTVDFAIERPSLPWLLAIFVPAATMRLIAEENRDGTLELLLTHPIRGWIVLTSKFIAGFLFVAFAIIATLGIPIAVETAGDLDVGAAVGQYIGSLFLAASFVSIGLFTSSLTRNQIVAFIVGLSATMILMIMGLDIVAVTLPGRLATLLQDLSPVTHFSSVARGVIHLRDVLYFVALVSTFLSGTFLMVRGRTLSHKTAQYRNLQLGTAGLIIVSLLIGWSSTAIGGRIDLTEDKLFTMSDATADILNDLDDILTVELFQSKDPPVQVALVSRDVRDFLEDFADSSGGKVKLVHRFPDDDEVEARKAQVAGVPPVQFNVQRQGDLQITTGFLGLAMTYVDQREIIPFVRAVDGFEYMLAARANKMLQQQKKTVAFLTGHGELSPTAGYNSFAGNLSDTYEIVEITEVEDAPVDLAGIDVLVIAGPSTNVPEATVDQIRTYIDAGGKAMILIDSALIDQGQLLAQPNRNSFASFANEYGVIVENDIVFDKESNETLSFSTQLGSVFLPYPFWMRVQVVDKKLAGDVESALLPWASSIGISEAARARIEVVPLLETSAFAAIDFAYGDVRPNSPILDQVDDSNQFQSLMGVAVANKTDSDTGFRLVVVGNSIWLSDPISERSPQNLALGLNLIDWLAQEDAMAAVRSKVVTQRRLLFSSETHENVARWANVGGVPLLLIAIGLLRSARRRKFGVSLYGQARSSLGRGRRRDRTDDNRDSEGDPE
ncbi:MAG TPA: Gldg family protein [SAR202 cluster bacterium]|nr:Gldg family protein [SAR202 cluster bacterium]